MRKSWTAVAAGVAGLVLVTAVGGCSSSGKGSSSSKGSSNGSNGSNGYGGSSSAPSAPSGKASAVKTASVGKLGKVLVDGQGRTLYLFEKDTSAKSTCSGGCATAWPPEVTTGTPKASGGVQSKELGTTKRSDGRTEVTYHGHPLYRYAGDSAAGQANGEGLNQFGAKWYAVGANGSKVDKS